MADTRDEDYTMGSDVAPPPSYEEAVNNLEAGASSDPDPKDVRLEVPLHGARPLSQIDVYQNSRLFPLMMRVKDVLQMLTKEVKRMEEDKTGLAQEIIDMEDKSYQALMSFVKPIAEAKIPASTDGNESWFGGGVPSKTPTPSYSHLKTDWLRDLQRNMKNIRVWIEDQLKQDVDWEGGKPRVPAISNVDLRGFKSSMMKVESGWNKFHNLRQDRDNPACLIDYATDTVIKMDMEYFWSLLVRMGDSEDDEEKDEAVPTTPMVEGKVEGKDDVDAGNGDDDGDDDGDEDGQRRRKLFKNYLGSRVLSKEEEEQAEEMGPVGVSMIDDDGLPKREAGKDEDNVDDNGDDNVDDDSVSAAGMATTSNTELSRGAVPAKDDEGTVVSEDDIDVVMTTNPQPRSESPDGFHLEVYNYSPKHSTLGDTDPDPSTVHQFEIDETDAEAGRNPRRRSRDKYDVGSMPIPLCRGLINFVVRKVLYTKDHWSEFSLLKKLILVFSVLFVVGLVLLVSLLPASFVYVDYYEMGFVYNKATGQTDTSRVYEFGCHLMAPQHSLVLFPSTVQFVHLRLSVMNQVGMTIGLELSFQYLLRPNELSQLYRRYNRGYDQIVRKVAESTVKNMAMEFSLEEYRLNRPLVEARLFHRLKRVLSGDCCNHDNARYKRLQKTFSTTGDNSSIACNANTTTCDVGYHLDLAFFQMGEISVPPEVMGRYLRQITLRQEAERELLIQAKALVVKETSLQVQDISNQANEIKHKALAESHKVKVISEATKLRLVEQSRAQSLKKAYKMLNITQEETKTSLLFLKTLQNVKDNLLVFSFNYDKNTAMSP